MAKDTDTYCLTMRNRPGEFVKLTKRLTDAGVSVSGLRVANLGEKSSVEFTAPRGCVLPAGLLKARAG